MTDEVWKATAERYLAMFNASCRSRAEAEAAAASARERALEEVASHFEQTGCVAIAKIIRALKLTPPSTEPQEPKP